MSALFHVGGSAAPGRVFIDRCAEYSSARRNFVFGQRTLPAGCNPMVLVTTPPLPASKARTMFDSDSVGGADDSRNGFLKRTPVNIVERSGAMMVSSARGRKGRPS